MEREYTQKELMDALLPSEEAEGPTREEMKAYLTEKAVEFAANIKQPALVELYNAELAKG